MAIRPDYDIGTVALVASSANFSTTGSALQTAAVQAGDAIIAPSGHVLIIASITGQNSGTLFLPCPPAAAGTGLALRIRFQPDGSRYQGAVRNLIDLLSSGNVEALSGLTGEEGKVPVFTGPGAMALQDYIADPNGSLANLAEITLTANKWLGTDANGDLAMIDPQNIVRGSNANGQFVRLPDGTQFCWGTVNFSGGGGATVTGTWTFPAAFSGSFPISAGFRVLAPPASGVRERSYWGNPSAASQVIFAMSVNTSFPSGFSESAECWASGRWF